jgi:hypothetical protein
MAGAAADDRRGSGGVASRERALRRAAIHREGLSGAQRFS